MKGSKCLWCGSLEVYDDSFGTEVCPYCKLPKENYKTPKSMIQPTLKEVLEK